jgi:hypothetical protein
MDFIKTQLDDITIKMGINVFLGEDKGVLKETLELDSSNNKQVSSFPSFKLPIQYQPSEHIHTLSPTVVADLELAESDSQKPIYEFIFQPTHDFSKEMIQEWKTTISIDPRFLKETQTVVENMGLFENQTDKPDHTQTHTTSKTYTGINKVAIDDNEDSSTSLDTTRLKQIWNDLTNDPYFLEKYSYIEFDFLNYLNYSPSFLQFVTYANIISPLASILFPIVVLILPFLILKFTNNNLTLSSYINVLQELAKNHFIGKAITNMQKIDMSKVVYIFGSFLMYLIQIYNNVVTCCHFYRNILKVNGDLMYLREFLRESRENMEMFVNLHASKPTYSLFCKDLLKYSNILKSIECELSPITPFTVSLSKLSKIGYMLKCYYSLYSNEEYLEALEFSFGFEGYIDNMRGVYNNWKNGNVSLATFVEKEGGKNNTEPNEETNAETNEETNTEPNEETNEEPNSETDDIETSDTESGRENNVSSTTPSFVKNTDKGRGRRGNLGFPTDKHYSSLTIKNQYYPPYDIETAVKNTIRIGHSTEPLISKKDPTGPSPLKGIIITGPNASGKTTLLKTTALNIIFSQQVGMGYYSSCRMKPYKYIHSYLNIPDTSGRDSLFQAEARRCKEIINSIHSSKEGDKHFCMFDELYSGTNPVEASKASYAFLSYLTEFKDVHFMLTTHYNCVCKKILKKCSMNIKNYKMDVKELVGENGEKQIEYTYRMVNGISNVEGAINVLRTLEYPQKIIDFFENK